MYLSLCERFLVIKIHFNLKKFYIELSQHTEDKNNFGKLQIHYNPNFKCFKLKRALKNFWVKIIEEKRKTIFLSSVVLKATELETISFRSKFVELFLRPLDCRRFCRRSSDCRRSCRSLWSCRMCVDFR